MRATQLPVTQEILFLLLGLILLWMPRAWLRLGRSESSRSSRKQGQHGGPNRDRMPGDQSLWAGEEFGRRRNWVDFARALAGGTAVTVNLPTVALELINVPDARVASLVLGLQGAVFVAAVGIQMLRIEEKLTLFPPVFFVLGLAFAVVGWKPALLGFIGIWAINAILPNPSIFMATYAALIVILSVFLGKHGVKPGVLMAGLSAFPPIVAVLFRRRLVQYRKRTKIIVR